MTKNYCLRLCWIIVFIISPIILSAQKNNWKNDYNKQGSEVKKLEWLLNTLKQRKLYIESEVDMLEEAETLSKKLQIDSLTAKTHTNIGKYYQRYGDMQAAWDEFQIAKKIFLSNRLYDYTAGVIYNQAIVLLNQGLGDSILNYLNSYNALLKVMRDEQMKLYLRTMKATAHQTMKRKAEAQKEYEIILPIAFRLKDTSLILSTLINVGMLQKRFDSAMYYYSKGIEIAKINSPDKYAELLCKIGFLYNTRDDKLRDSALFYYMEADKNEAYFVSPILRIQTKNFISDFFISRQEYNLALPYLRKAYSLSKHIPGTDNPLILHNLAICFIDLKNLDSANHYIAAYRKAIDNNGSDYNWMLFYNAQAKLLMLDGDSCSNEVIKSRQKALGFARNINEIRIANHIILEQIECILIRGAGVEYAGELLEYCAYNKPLIKERETLFLYETFLANYAKLEAAYGNKNSALSLYNELTEVMQRIENETYTAGHNEALVKYQSEIKDHEIAYSKRKNQELKIGAALLCFVRLVIVLALLSTYRLNKKIKAQRNELEQLNVVKDRLFSVISHDMRAPVSSLLSFIQLLERGNISAEKMPAFTVELKTRLGYTAGLMDNLLNWAHSQMKGYKPQMKMFDLNNVVFDVINILNTEAEKKQIIIENRIERNYVIYADENMTSLLLRNLLSNAIKFSHSGQAVIISSINNNKIKGFYVQDSGVGINQEVVNEFNNSSSDSLIGSVSGTANEKGTGLGLMLCKTFAGVMGGKIWLSSEIGNGSCFTVEFA